MNRRFRLLGSLVALLALFAYFAQGVQAAACGPTMSAEAHATSHDTHGDISQEAPADAQDCPLGMLMSGTCSIAFLPAPLALVTTDSPQAILLLAAPADAHDLIIAAPPFHPPRA